MKTLKTIATTYVSKPFAVSFDSLHALGDKMMLTKFISLSCPLAVLLGLAGSHSASHDQPRIALPHQPRPHETRWLALARRPTEGSHRHRHSHRTRLHASPRACRPRAVPAPAAPRYDAPRLLPAVDLVLVRSRRSRRGGGLPIAGRFLGRSPAIASVRVGGSVDRCPITDPPVHLAPVHPLLVAAWTARPTSVRAGAPPVPRRNGGGDRPPMHVSCLLR